MTHTKKGTSGREVAQRWRQERIWVFELLRSRMAGDVRKA